jgi:hypothetical protein
MLTLIDILNAARELKRAGVPQRDLSRALRGAIALVTAPPPTQPVTHPHG